MKRLAIYAHFGESPKVARYVWYFLKELRSLGFEICFVSNSPISIENQSEISTLCQKFIQRENTGYDFSMWQAGLAEYDLSKLEELLLTNSSIIGPLQPLAALWQNSSVNQCDFWGLTDNDEFGRHLQTYFMVFRRPVIQAACFMDFWRSILPLRDKQQVIQNYEIGLTRRLEENGFKWKAVFAQERMWSLFLSRRSFVKKIGDWYYNRGLPGRNTTTLLPDLLLQCGMPFLKAALLREAHGQMSPKMAFELLEASSLPLEILEELRLKKNSAWGARPHVTEIANDVFDKPEIACYKLLLREMDEEVQNLRAQVRAIEGSRSYRLGRGLLAPARLLRKLWRCFH